MNTVTIATALARLATLPPAYGAILGHSPPDSNRAQNSIGQGSAPKSFETTVAGASSGLLESGLHRQIGRSFSNSSIAKP